MKLKNLFLALFACALFSISFSSCSDDDDDVILSTVVTNLAFSDTDPAENSISGTITWTKPTGWKQVESLVIYTSRNGISRDEILAEVEPNAGSYTIEEPIEYVKFFIVVAKLTTGKEDTNFAKVAVMDKVENSPERKGIYVLNSGNNGDSNSNLAFYDFNSQDVTYKVFQTQNGKAIGDTGQDMIVYGTKMYIAVSGSNLIYVTDKQGKEISVIRPEEGKGHPRNFTTLNGKVYVTMFDGYLAKIDTASYTIENTVKVGRYPEYVRTANNKLYVSNSGGPDWNNELGYDKTVSVINANTFTKETDIEVVVNPDKMTVDNDGNIYVISNGNYSTIPSCIQKINGQTSEVKKLDITASWMVCNGDKLYYIYSHWDDPNPVYGVFDTKKEEIITTQFITDGTVVKNPYSISTDTENGYVYIGTSTYTTNGDMYIFNSNGELIKKFDTGGLNPMGAYFVK